MFISKREKIITELRLAYLEEACDTNTIQLERHARLIHELREGARSCVCSNPDRLEKAIKSITPKKIKVKGTPGRPKKIKIKNKR